MNKAKGPKTIALTTSEAFTANTKKLGELIDSHNAVLRELQIHRRTLIIVILSWWLVLLVAILKL